MKTFSEYINEREGLSFKRKDFETLFKSKFDAIVKNKNIYALKVGNYTILANRTVLSLNDKKMGYYLITEILQKTDSSYEDIGLRNKYKNEVDLILIPENDEGYKFLESRLLELNRTNDLNKFIKELIKYSKTILK